MGMFDNIECNYPLPITKELLELEDFNIDEVEFQTKSFENLLELYIISEDGELLRKKSTYEWYDDDEYFLKGYMKEVSSEIVKETFFGVVEFYCYEQLRKEVNGKVREISVSVDYEAKFNDGKLISLDLVDQSIEDTTEHYEKIQAHIAQRAKDMEIWYNKYFLYTNTFRKFKRICIYKPLNSLHKFTGWLLTQSYKI